MALIFVLALAGPVCLLRADEKAVVIVPAADIWSEPATTTAAGTDDKRETQVLFGEPVVIHETQGDWARIDVMDQPEFTHHQKWEGYPGWIETRALQVPRTFQEPVAVVLSTWTATMQPETLPDVWLPLGSFIRPQGKTDYLFIVSTPLGDRCVNISTTKPMAPHEMTVRRKDILITANIFLGVPYLWGGLTVNQAPLQSLVTKTLKYGVDCSGLVHLCYRLNGVQVPRDSYEQWMKSTPVKRIDLMPADLIFSAKASHPKKITHVAIYTGNERIIEAPQTGMVVRQLSFKEKYGKDLAQVESGDTVGDRVIYYGRLQTTD